ncbi:hypothetical protein [Pedobacter psychrodurus]|uniref:hypothetical protein n=1 Tax=Pedobacter psychrodurus TaxID=2530456 RepID=UPI00292DF475|nr:hypothetical protein [Pedobacter psychrodurus]
MEVSYIKYFLRVFLPLLDRKNDRAAIRFMFRHTAFFSISKGKRLFGPNHRSTAGNLIIVGDGLVNGYLRNNEEEHANIWLGTKGSVYIYNHSKMDDNFNLFAIEDAIVFLIDQSELKEGCAWYPVLDTLFNAHLLRKAFSDVNNRNILFRLQHTENRISLFRRMYPGLFDRMPTDLLLSYLDINLNLTCGHELEIDGVFNNSTFNDV